MSFRYLSGLLFLLVLAACQREQRNFRPQPSQTGLLLNVAAEGTLQPGGAQPQTPPSNPDEGNAYAIAEGQRLYNWYNCSGCHSHGGGGIGPPLIKKSWIYGGESSNLFDTIAKGRPNGMPTWGGRIPTYQIWQLVTYIRSMNQEEPTSATPPRTDNIETEPAIRNPHGVPRNDSQGISYAAAVCFSGCGAPSNRASTPRERKRSASATFSASSSFCWAQFSRRAGCYFVDADPPS